MTADEYIARRVAQHLDRGIEELVAMETNDMCVDIAAHKDVDLQHYGLKYYHSPVARTWLGIERSK